MSAHSRYAPSSASRWVPCPGSVEMAALYPEEEEGESAAEGTAAHHYGSETLLGRAVAVGDMAPNGYLITAEMEQGARLWVQDVQDIAGPLLPMIQVESKIPIPRIHELCHGTADTWLYDPEAGRLTVWDFKFGHGVVEAFENWQAMLYVCGILDLCGIDGHADQHVTVDMRIVQPRAFHRDGRIRSWVCKASDLRGYFNQAHAAAHGTGLRTGGHCLHCPGRHACPALSKAVGACLDYMTATSAHELPPDQMGRELTVLRLAQTLIKARLTGAEANVTAKLRAGTRVDGWAFEPTYGRKDWTVSPEVVATLGDGLGVELRKPLDVITPTQAADKGVDAAVISLYSDSPRTGVKLVPDNNLLNKARSGFEQLQKDASQNGSD